MPNKNSQAILKNVKIAGLAGSQKNGLAVRNERAIVDRDDADDIVA